MKYAVYECINGNFFLKSEHSTPQSAIVKFHDECKGLWNSSDVITGMVEIIDENGDVYNNGTRYKEFITHPETVEE